jgi:tetratricopeptide (TPR) repeat protein
MVSCPGAQAESTALLKVLERGARNAALVFATVAAITVFLLASCAGSPKSAQSPAQTQNAQQKRVQEVQAAETLLNKGDKDDAAAAADKLGQLAAASPGDSDLKLAQAAALVSAGKLPEARKNVDAILASDPKNVQALSMGAELASFAGDDAARKSYLDRALVAAPSDASVLSAWGDYSLDTKNWPKADDFYRRALAADPKSADASLGLGRALYHEAKYADSEAELSIAIGLEPDSPLAYSDRSRARYQQGKYKEAEADLDTAIAKAPDESSLYIDRGRYRLDKGDMKGAGADFDKAVSLDPDYFLPYTYRGGVREEAGQDELALEDYRKVIELYPDYWYAFESAGAAAFRLGLWLESSTDFQRAFASNSEHYEYAIAGALALWRAGKPKEASAYAGQIAPGIDRDKNGIYWAMLRLIQDQNDASSELEIMIQAEKKLDRKGAMLFYLSEYWICRGRAELASKYLGLCEDMKRQSTLEYRLLLAEQKRIAASNS